MLYLPGNLKTFERFGTNSVRALQVFHAYMHTVWERLKMTFMNCDVYFFNIAEAVLVRQPLILELWFGEVVVR